MIQRPLTICSLGTGGRPFPKTMIEAMAGLPPSLDPPLRPSYRIVSQNVKKIGMECTIVCCYDIVLDMNKLTIVSVSFLWYQHTSFTTCRQCRVDERNLAIKALGLFVLAYIK